MTDPGPFLRWPHTKRRLVREILTLLPTRFSRYVEVSTTDASLFWVQPRSSVRCVLNIPDADRRNVYEQLRDQPDELVAAVVDLLEDQDEEEFYSIRTETGLSPVAAAARYLYLNALSTSWKAADPSPDSAVFSAKASPPFTAETLLEAARRLSKVNVTGDIPGVALEQTRKGDLVFLDESSTGTDVHEGLRATSTDTPATTVLVCVPDIPDVVTAYTQHGWGARALETRRPGTKAGDALVSSDPLLWEATSSR